MYKASFCGLADHAVLSETEAEDMMKRLMRGKIAYGYITPAIAIIFAIFVIPLVNLVVFSFAQVNLIGKIDKWVGTENYEILLTSSF